jgi:hypothetical protein
MSYEDESLSIPPEPRSARRRKDDHVDWWKVARVVAFSSPLWGPGLWQTVSVGLQVHAQWLVFQKLPAKIAELEEAAEAHEDLDKRLASLERYRCVLGYDPGGAFGKASILPRDRRSECRTEQKAPER